MDAKELFDSFYEKLVLRDLFGKIVPGFLFMCGVIFGVLGVDVLTKFMSNMTTTVSVIAIGFSWILGCALQYFGEFCHLLKTHPPEFPTRQDFYPYWARFYNAKTATERERVQAERLNVIKEACGNTAVAIASVCLISPICQLARGALTLYPTAPLLVLGLGASYCFWQMHLIHVTRYGEFLKNTVDFRENGPDDAPGDSKAIT